MTKSVQPGSVWEIMNYEILITCGLGMILMIFWSIAYNVAKNEEDQYIPSVYVAGLDPKPNVRGDPMNTYRKNAKKYDNVQHDFEEVAKINFDGHQGQGYGAGHGGDLGRGSFIGERGGFGRGSVIGERGGFGRGG